MLKMGSYVAASFNFLINPVAEVQYVHMYASSIQ